MKLLKQITLIAGIFLGSVGVAYAGSVVPYYLGGTGNYAAGYIPFGTGGYSYAATSSALIFNNTNTFLGVGTSTPNATVEIANASGQQLTLSDASLTSSQWSFRNVAGTLNIGTSSPSTYATNTPSAIQISSQAATQVGIASSTPWRTLDVTGTVAVNGLSAAASGSIVVCINSTTKELILGGGATTCAPSNESFKKDIETSNVGLTELMKLRPITFYFKEGDTQQQLGLGAVETSNVDKRLVQLLPDGKTVETIRWDNVAAVVIRSIQDQQAEIKAIEVTKGLSRGAEENIQDVLIGILVLYVLYNEYDKRRR